MVDPIPPADGTQPTAHPPGPPPVSRSASAQSVAEQMDFLPDEVRAAMDIMSWHMGEEVMARVTKLVENASALEETAQWETKARAAQSKHDELLANKASLRELKEELTAKLVTCNQKLRTVHGEIQSSATELQAVVKEWEGAKVKSGLEAPVTSSAEMELEAMKAALERLRLENAQLKTAIAKRGVQGNARSGGAMRPPTTYAQMAA
ncbi:hypothetical protein FBU31_006361, partial [Coemansia sp. 'formosensis']